MRQGTEISRSREKTGVEGLQHKRRREGEKGKRELWLEFVEGGSDVETGIPRGGRQARR